MRCAFVWLVTGNTGLSAVHRHRGQRALLHAVAALAVRWLVAFDSDRGLAQTSVNHASVDGNARGLCLQGFIAARPLERERVATRAHGLRLRPEAFGGFHRGVPNMPLFFVTGRAAIRRHWTDLVDSRGVAFRAFDFLLLHVNAMARHIAREAPGFVDVNAGPPLPVLRRSFLPGLWRSFVLDWRRFFLVRAGGKRGKHEYWDQHPREH